ncbi:MAG TPA: hypothetical protein VF950_14230 [Planctomycetota bacterium]
MDWYLKQLIRDKRFKIAGGISLGSIVAVVLCAVLGAKWSYAAAAFAFFPLFLLSTIAIFVVLGLIVRADMLDRQGRR